MVIMERRGLRYSIGFRGTSTISMKDRSTMLTLSHLWAISCGSILSVVLINTAMHHNLFLQRLLVISPLLLLSFFLMSITLIPMGSNKKESETMECNLCSSGLVPK